MSNIVNVIVNVLVGAQPNLLQQTGAIVSQGGTTLTPATGTALTALGYGPTLFLSQASDLTSHLTAAQAITGTMAWSGSVVTVTFTGGGHGYTVSGAETVAMTIAGVLVGGSTNNGYNGTFNCTITNATTLTFPLASNPGTAVLTSAVITDYDVAELTNQVANYFAQGGNNGVYVLELGEGTSAQGVTTLGSWLTANPQVFYVLLLPLTWDAEPTLLALTNLYTATTAMQYFVLPVSASTWATYVAKKSVIMMATSPAAPVTEVPTANVFNAILNLAPSMINRVTQFAYKYLYGVTAWPKNNSSIVTMNTNNVNYVDTGAEGGISNTILKMGVVADSTQINHWYAIDWTNINGHLMLANTIINGSNNTINPLYYDQNGINRLQATLQDVINQGVSFGLIGGTPVVSAIDYKTYTAANPTHYALGIYNGLSVIIATQQGFQTITFNLTVTNLAP
jgi:hypothetical protein